MENNWINVEDRLPEEEVNVLAFEDGNMEVAAYFGTDQAGQPCWASKYGMLHRVSYWQPLPESPGETVNLTEKLTSLLKET